MPNSEKTASNRAQRIREARRSAGMSQEELARACGVTTSAVAQWESRSARIRTVPSTAHLLCISQATGRSVDWLSGLAPPRPAATPGPPPATTGQVLDAYQALVEAVGDRFPELEPQSRHQVALALFARAGGAIAAPTGPDPE
ncbi:MAG: helix-turn-helix domain-containing protein [Lysobacteraceae bacterium]